MRTFFSLMHQIFRKIIGLSLLFLSFYFALSALQWHQKYEDGKGEYEELAQENTEKPKTEADNGTKMDPYMKIDWGKLKGQNSDLVGWIVMDPNVNYPVVQGEDNAYYLHRGFTVGTISMGVFLCPATILLTGQTRIRSYMDIICVTDPCLAQTVNICQKNI